MSAPHLTLVAGLVSVILGGAIFGFFYAWVCSTMWGLDAIDPRTAIAAMNGMNTSVQNAVFFPAFFLTPVALGLTASLALVARRPGTAGLMGTAAIVLVLGVIVVTFLVNVTMNEALATTGVPEDPSEAARVWRDYSARWQGWNQVRITTSGIALLLAALGLALVRTPGP